MMEDDNQANQDNQLSNRDNYNQQIISIRKRLVAPNDILPGNMIRSKILQHFLPIKTELSAQPGFQMPIDSVQQYSQIEQTYRPQAARNKAFLIKGNKHTTKSQISYTVKSQNMISLSNNNPYECLQNNFLHFLNNNLKNILKYSNNIVFISPSILLGQVDTPPSPYFSNKNQQKEQKLHEKKLSFIKILNDNKNFPSIAYDYKADKSLTKIAQLDELNNQSNDVIFNDKFQSSNILLSFKYSQQLNKNISQQQLKINKQEQVYIIITRFDYNTKSYGQWFYFQVKRNSTINHQNKAKSNIYKFMIINMTKNKTMFGNGLKISVCRNGVWRKQGFNIKYYRNSVRRQETSDNFNESFVQDQYFNNYINSPQFFYTLEFNLEISHGQEVYVAYNEPYTYSRLGRLLDKIVDKYQTNSTNVINLKRHRILQKTHLSNSIDCITFSAKKNKIQSITPQQKKVIIIMGRTHPIQTAGSHVVQGILNQIYKSCIENPQQCLTNDIFYKLLQHYVIKIIPMVNPDGVIVGNSRCNINGYDLNRCWRSTKKDKCKQIYYIKNHILEYQERIQMFIDLHAHSKKKNVFAYGCHDNSNPFATRQFPYLLSKVSQKDFLFQECRFTKISDIKSIKNKKISKDGTARIFLYDTLKIPNVFTIQNSYCSAKGSIFHYDEHSYQKIGSDILKAIALYFLPFYKQSKQEMKQAKNDDNKYTNQIQLSLNTRYIKDLSLNISINENESIKLQLQNENCLDEAKQLRQNIMKQLLSNQQNVTLGLVKYCSISDSEEQKRINQGSVIGKKQRNLSLIELKKKIKKSNISSLNNEYKQQTQIIPLSKNARTTTKQALNISSAHSETTLAKAYKITKDRLKTLGKQSQQTIIQSKIGVLNAEKEHGSLMAEHKKYKIKMSQTKRNPHLTVIEIGANKDLQKINQNKLQMLKSQQKQRIVQVNELINYKLQKLNSQRAAQNKDQQVKQHFRAIIKRNYKFYPIQKKNVNNMRQKAIKDIFTKRQRAMDLKQSEIIFNGINLADKQVRHLKNQIKQQNPQNDKKVYNNQFLNTISKIKINNNKSQIKSNNNFSKYQNSTKVSKSPNLLINDFRLSKLISLKTSNNFQKCHLLKQPNKQ